MKAAFRFLDIVSWPIWLKLLIGFAVALLLPALVIGVVGLNAVNQSGGDTIRSYLEITGEHQVEQIALGFNQAINGLNTFINNNTTRRTLVDLLEDDPDLPDLTLVTKATTLLTELQSSTNPIYYTNFWLLNADGKALIVLRSDTQVPTGSDLSKTDLFASARQATEDNALQVLALSDPNDSPTLQIVNEVKRASDGQTVGYLVATLDAQIIIYRNLRIEEDTSNGYSFMLSPDGQVFASDETRDQARDAAQSNAATRLYRNMAVSNVSGVTTYASGKANNREVIAYSAPITVLGEVFGIFTEVNANDPAINTLRQLNPVFFPIFVGFAALLLVLLLLFNQLFRPPLAQLADAIRAMAAGNFSEAVPSAKRHDEIGAVSAAFVDMREQVRTLIDDLSTRMVERVRDVEATQEISRYAATQRDLQTLLDRVVSLMVERFPNIYHAQIFLVDVDQQYAVLRSSTGAAGQQLLKRGHRLLVGSVSVIGQVTQEGQVIVARDTTTSTIHRANEFLPDTRAELAIPLRIGSSIIGALDLQSRQSGLFTDDQVRVLQTMADQISIAIQNARLYQENLRRQQEIEVSNRAATRRVWQEYLAGQRQRHLSSEAGTQTGSDLLPLRQEALTLGKPVVGKLTERQTIPIAVPIQLRGQTLGAVEWELPAQDFDASKVLLAQELVARLAVSLDNARLFQESRRATERERLVNTIASKLTQQTDVGELLQTAVREVGQALRSPQVNIRLHWSDTTQDAPDEKITNGTNGSGNANGA